jgi:hypothetical protein
MTGRTYKDSEGRDTSKKRGANANKVWVATNKHTQDRTCLFELLKHHCSVGFGNGAQRVALAWDEYMPQKLVEYILYTTMIKKPESFVPCPSS